MSFADRKRAFENCLQSDPGRYGFAVLAVAFATLANHELAVALGTFPPFFVFLLAVLLVAGRTGFGPGVLTTGLSSASVLLFSETSLKVFASSRVREIAALIAFSGFGAGLSRLVAISRQLEDRDREYERLAEGLEEMVVVMDREYRYLIANQAFLTYRGMKKEDVIGRHASEILDPGVFESEIKARLDQCFAGRIVQFDMKYCYPTKGERELLVSYFPIAGRGRVSRAACVLQDVTEKRKIERARTLLRTLIDHSSDAVIVVDPETLRLLDVNETACRELGYAREELLSLRVSDIDPTVDKSCREETAPKLLAGEAVLRETVHRRKDGSVFPAETSLKQVLLDRSYVIAITRDISERKKAERELRESEDHYRDLIEHSTDLVCTHNLQGILLSVNPAPAQALGYEISELVGMSMGDLLAPEFRPQFDAYLERIRTKGADHGLLCVVTKGGERRIWEYSNTVRTEGVAQPIVRGLAHDVTERTRAEQALRRSEEQYRLLFERNVAAVSTARVNGEAFECNRAWARMLGFDSPEQLRGRKAEEFYFDLADRDALRSDLLRTGLVLGRELCLRREDGAAVWLLCNAIVRPAWKDGEMVMQSTAIDITERKRAEENVRRSEERFRVALKDSPTTVFNQDKELRYTWIYNPQLYCGPDVLGKTDEEILGKKAAAVLTALKQRVLETGTAVRQEVKIGNNGKGYAFDLSLEPVFDGKGNVAGITGACVNIARLWELADHLQDAKDRLAQQKTYLEAEIQTELGFEKIVGQSPALREALKKARIVAPTDSTVLLLGETGTGKELVARSIHSLSSRSDKTFVKLNCAAVPSGLLESELFGHEKGAFTGAISQKVGRIELAEKGTLFLDEIGELPLELQPKLLRVLQDREFERLGGVQTRKVDVRIISATNRDLGKDVAEKKFREDLYYRLNVFPIELPPLRERREDIPGLVRYFLDKHASRMGKSIETVSDESMHILRNWNWPGNIRELENMIERMVIMTKGNILVEPPAELDSEAAASDDNLTEIEREHILRVLRETQGILSGPGGAASRLGLKRTTLQSMLKRFKIDAGEFRRGNGTFGGE